MVVYKNYPVSPSPGATPYIYTWQTSNEMYFNVPVDTGAFIMGTSGSGKTTTALTGRLIDPDGNVVQDIEATTDTEYQIENPIPGVWKIVIDQNVRVVKSRVWLLGVPPLVWHDAQYLLVQEGAAPLQLLSACLSNLRQRGIIRMHQVLT